MGSPTTPVHELDTSTRPPGCSCGGASYVGSPTFVRERHAIHLEDVAGQPFLPESSHDPRGYRREVPDA